MMNQPWAPPQQQQQQQPMQYGHQPPQQQQQQPPPQQGYHAHHHAHYHNYQMAPHQVQHQMHHAPHDQPPQHTMPHQHPHQHHSMQHHHQQHMYGGYMNQQQPQQVPMDQQNVYQSTAPMYAQPMQAPPAHNQPPPAPGPKFVFFNPVTGAQLKQHAPPPSTSAATSPASATGASPPATTSNNNTAGSNNSPSATGNSNNNNTASSNNNHGSAAVASDAAEKAKAEPADAAKKAEGCGCSRAGKHAGHLCAKICSEFLKCDGSCGLPGEKTAQKGSLKSQKGAKLASAGLASRPLAAGASKAAPLSDAHKPPAQAALAGNTQQQQPPAHSLPQPTAARPQPAAHQPQPGPQQSSPLVHGSHANPVDMGPPDDRMHPAHYAQHQHPLNHSGHHPNQAHSPMYMQHPHMPPHSMGPPPMGHSPMNAPAVQPKPAGKQLHVDAAPFVAKNRSHAVAIVPPPGDPRGQPAGSRIYSFNDVEEVQNEVLQNLEDRKCSIKPLIKFTADYGHFWKSKIQRTVAGPRVNVITQGSQAGTKTEQLKRKVTGILNKLTPERYEKLKGQIFEIMDGVMQETDTIELIASILYEEAVTVKHFTVVFTDLCYDMSSYQQAKLGLPSIGRTGFRKALVNKCQQEYHEYSQSSMPEGFDEMTPEEQKAALALKEVRLRRRALNNINFVGELYKKNLLTEKIMHTVLDAELRGNVDDARLEKVAQLLTTVGHSLDQEQESKKKMDGYFTIIQDLQIDRGTTRIGWLLLDVMDLRKNHWQSTRNAIGAKGPQKLFELDRVMQQEEARRERGWGTSAQSKGGNNNLRPPELTVSAMIECLSSDNLEETKKRLLGIEYNKRVLIVDEIVAEVIKKSDTTTERVMRGLGQFINNEVDAIGVDEVVFKAAKQILVKMRVNASWRETSSKQAWACFGVLLQAVGSSNLQDLEVGNEVLYNCITIPGPERAMDLGPLLREFMAVQLKCHSASYVALKYPNAPLFGHLVEYLGATAEPSLCIAALLLDDSPLPTKLSAIEKMDAPTVQVVSAVLAAELVKNSNSPATDTWCQDKSAAEQDFLRHVLGKHDSADLSASVQEFEDIALRLEENDVTSLTRSLSEFMKEAELL